MPAIQIVSGALRFPTARIRIASTGRRAVLLLGAIGMMAGVAVVTSGPALAGVGSEPGNLKFNPASGATNVRPAWSTTDGCPDGYRGSAEVSIFNTRGTFISRISNVAYNVNAPFGGTLDGNLAAILRFANVPGGQGIEFAVGCYTQVGGTGSVKWMQSALVTLSSDGKSYTTSAPSGQQVQPSGPGVTGTNSGGGGASASATQGGGGMGAPAEAALIAGACLLAAGGVGYVWYRRRNRSRLM